MNKMRIGDMRQRLKLEDATQTPDGGGGGNETWIELMQVWASIKPLSGQERAESDAIAGRVSHEVLVRHHKAIAPKMRFRMGARLFDIRAVLDIDERNRFMKCLVEERDL